VTVRTGFVEFASNLEKARYMAAAGAGDVRQREVLRWAAVFNQLPLPKRPAAILRFCQYAIEYIRDPKAEVLEDSTVTLTRGFGDCDAKARVFVALCRACGIRARIYPVRPALDFPHVLAEVMIDGQWRRADPTILNSGIGDIPPGWRAVTNYR